MKLRLGRHIQKDLLRVHELRIIPLKLLVDVQLGHVHNWLVKDAYAGGTLGEEAGRNAHRVHGKQAQRVDGGKEKGSKGDAQREKEDDQQVDSQPIEAAFPGQIARDSLKLHHHDAH